MNKLYTHRLFFLFFIFLSNQSIANDYKIAFGSCLDQELPQPIWKTIEGESIDSFIFLGDNVYGDSVDGKLDKMKLAYNKQEKMIPSWLKEKDLFYIWDDHDYGVNDGGLEYKYKKEAQQLYLDFWNSKKDDKRRSQEGTYFNSIINIDDLKLNIIGLDTRYFRSSTKNRQDGYEPLDKENITMLGKDQWTWLYDALSNEADLIILLSSVQVLPTIHQFEKWEIFPNERVKLLNALENIKTKTIILSGDRHRAGVYEYGDIVEITSSSLNKAIADSWYEKLILNLMPKSMQRKFIDPKEQDEFQINELISEVNYGLMTIDSINRTVLIEIKDISGKPIQSYLKEI